MGLLFIMTFIFVPSEKVKAEESTETLLDITCGTSIGLEEYKVTYNGKEQKPEVFIWVMNGSYELVEGVDYTCTYTNNIYPGTGKVTITGIGKYTGVSKETFKIVNKKKSERKSLKKAKISVAKKVYYNGKEKRPAVTVKLGKKTLVEGIDYNVYYYNNKNVGTAHVFVQGKLDYKDEARTTFAVTVKKGTTFTSGGNKYKVTGISTVEFVGLKNKKTTKVKIPSMVEYKKGFFKVTSIADNALKNKTNVKSVEMSAYMKNIGDYAFYGCKNMTKIKINSSVATIGKEAFAKCSSLKSVTLPLKLEEIKKKTFYGCKNLKNITVLGTKIKKVGSQAFKGVSSAAVIEVPKNKVSAYKKLFKGKGLSNSATVKKSKLDKYGGYFKFTYTYGGYYCVGEYKCYVQFYDELNDNMKKYYRLCADAGDNNIFIFKGTTLSGREYINYDMIGKGDYPSYKKQQIIDRYFNSQGMRSTLGVGGYLGDDQQDIELRVWSEDGEVKTFDDFMWEKFEEENEFVIID